MKKLINRYCKAIFWTLVFLTEIHSCKAEGISDLLSKNTQIITNYNEFQRINNGQLIFFHYENLSHRLFTDDEFMINSQCSEFSRRVEYCMWKEFEETILSSSSTEIFYVHKRFWSKDPIDSTTFKCQNYKNPYVEIIPELNLKSDISTKYFNISEKMPLYGERTIINFHLQQLREFVDSPYSDEFKYAGYGLFYSEISKMKKSLMQRIGLCNVGDRRVWFECWAPKSITVIGKYENGEILPIDFKGIKIGSINSGILSLKETLHVHISPWSSELKWYLRIFVLYNAIMFLSAKKKDDNFTFSIIFYSIFIIFFTINKDLFVDQSIQLIVFYSFLFAFPIVFSSFILNGFCNHVQMHRSLSLDYIYP